VKPDQLRALRSAYRTFFKSEHGQYFIAELDRLINELHIQAENDPEHSRDLVQNAKGVRLVGAHVISVTNEGKK
jgi:hypothetical protein